MPTGIYKQVASDVMTHRAETIRTSDRLEDAIRVMSDCGLSALPVENAQGECVGLLSKTDLIQQAQHLRNKGNTGRSAIADLFFGIGLDDLADTFVDDASADRLITVMPGP